MYVYNKQLKILTLSPPVYYHGRYKREGTFWVICVYDSDGKEVGWTQARVGMREREKMARDLIESLLGYHRMTIDLVLAPSLF